jgi:hypothetical protein
MDFSPVSGHVYTGVVTGVDKAVNIIDAQASPITNTNIMVGADIAQNQIPVSGYVHATHHHPYVMTTGYKKDVAGSEMGYLSIIDASNSDTVVDVIELGNLASSSFDISEMEMGGTAMIRVFVPSRKDNNVEGEITNQIAVIDIDPETGMKYPGTAVRYIDVGEGASHRNGVISPDAMYAYYPDGGDCAATTPETCMTIRVISVHDETVIHTLNTAGHEPGSLTVVDASMVDTSVTGGGTGTGGHSH